MAFELRTHRFALVMVFLLHEEVVVVGEHGCDCRMCASVEKEDGGTSTFSSLD
jgi:hypothetical protein